MFFACVNMEMKGVLSDLMGIEVKSLPARYLGVPLISTKLRARDYDSIEDKMLSRIQHWSTKSLSYAGRVQLAISVLHSIQAFWCSVFILPKKVLKGGRELLSVVLFGRVWI